MKTALWNPVFKKKKKLKKETSLGLKRLFTLEQEC